MNITQLIQSARDSARSFVAGKSAEMIAEQLDRAVREAWAYLQISETGDAPAADQFRQFESAFGAEVLSTNI